MENKKRCLFCHRLLVDEKVPVCTRCEKTGVKWMKTGIEIVGGAAFAVATVISQKNDNDSTKA